MTKGKGKGKARPRLADWLPVRSSKGGKRGGKVRDMFDDYDDYDDYAWKGRGKGKGKKGDFGWGRRSTKGGGKGIKGDDFGWGRKGSGKNISRRQEQTWDNESLWGNRGPAVPRSIGRQVGGKGGMHSDWDNVGIKRKMSDDFDPPPAKRQRSMGMRSAQGRDDDWLGPPVRRAAPARGGLGGASRKIRVSNIPKNLDWRDIKEAFSDQGRLEKVVVERGVAFITFETVSEARKAVQTFDRGELNGQTIHVTFE